MPLPRSTTKVTAVLLAGCGVVWPSRWLGQLSVVCVDLVQPVAGSIARLQLTWSRQRYKWNLLRFHLLLTQYVFILPLLCISSQLYFSSFLYFITVYSHYCIKYFYIVGARSRPPQLRSRIKKDDVDGVKILK